MKLASGLIAASLAFAMVPSYALSINTTEGQRFLLVTIADEDVSFPREISAALRMGGHITVNWEAAHKQDPNFEKDNVGSVFCDDVKKAKGFDPASAEMSCVSTTPALMTWIGKYGWQIHSVLILGQQMLFVKPWSEH